MPKFIDYHATMPQMPPEAMQEMKTHIQAGQPNQFGAKAINIFMGSGGQGYCLTEAPNADAVIKSHEANGVPLDRSNIIEVVSLV